MSKDKLNEEEIILGSYEIQDNKIIYFSFQEECNEEHIKSTIELIENIKADELIISKIP